MEENNKARWAIGVLFIINVAFNFEAAMAEFLLPVLAEALTVPVEKSQIILYCYYLAIIIVLAISLTSKSPLLTRVPGLIIGGILLSMGTFLLATMIGVGILEAVVVARILQGAGVALIVTATPTLIIHWRLSEFIRFSPFVLIPVSIGVGMLGGATLGAFAAELSAVSIILFTISIIIFSVLFIIPFVSIDSISGEFQSLPTPIHKWDFGGLLATCFSLLVIFVLSQLLSDGSYNLLSLFFCLGLVFVIYFLFKRSDRLSDYPVFDIYFLFQETNMIYMLIMNLLSFSATYVIVYVLPFYIYYEFLSSGVQLMLGGTIVFVPLGFVIGPLVFEAVVKTNITKSFWVSGLVFFAAIGGFLLASLTGSSWLLIFAGAMLGSARGIFILPYNKLTLNSVPLHRIDEMSIYSVISRYGGMAVGILTGAGLVSLSGDLNTALLWALGGGVLYMLASLVFISKINDEWKCHV
ncbi:hypothetical protein OAP63_00760 [Vibrio sp.]|nr:hypothetical protein [Vibrio sp.]